MEQHNEPHQTKLWISFDSPHEGANIAIGDQYFLDFYASSNEGAKKNRDNKISSVAAKQMLVHHYLANSIVPAGAPGFRDRFANLMANTGFPVGDAGQPFRKIALIDGNLGGIQVNTPSQKGFTFDARVLLKRRILFFFKFKIKSLTVASAEMYFTPAYGNTSSVLAANKPLWHYTTKTAYSPGYTTGFDTAPGGTYPTQQILQQEGDGITGHHTILGKVVNVIFSGLFDVESKFYSVVPTHSFISTKSALAFTGNNVDLAEDISTRSLVCTGETPFDSYYGDFNLNRDHVELWKDAITWVKNEINGIYQLPPVRNTAYSISGSASICSPQGGYTVNNLPSGATVTWSAKPDNIASISVSNNVATLTPTGNGSITLSASVITSCAISTVTIPVGVGTPPTVTSISATMSGSCRAGGYQDWLLQPTPSNPNATNWHWTVSNTSGSTTITFQNANSQNTIATVHGGGGVNVTFTDPCGNTSAPNGVTIYCPCGSGGSRVASYPNPADKEMTVDYQTADDSNAASTADQTSTANASTQSKPTNNFSVELYNDKGKVLKSGKSANGKGVVLNTADIQNGNYFLHVIDGKEVTKKQVIIQH